MKLNSKEIAILDKYRHLFNNTGGNDPRELIEREGITYFNNPIAAELQGCCLAQMLLISKLIQEGIIKQDTPEIDPNEAEWEALLHCSECVEGSGKIQNVPEPIKEHKS